MPPSPETPSSKAACVQRWGARDPAGPRQRSVEEWERFVVIRQRLLRHLLRDPRMWMRQGGNVLQGLARYATCLGLFLVLAPPVLAFWEAVLWPADPAAAAPDALLERWLQRGLLWLLGLGLADLLLGCRLNRVRNVFVDMAERLAWVVVDAEAPAAAGLTEPPGSS